MASYLEQLKTADPAAYAKLEQLMSYTAKEAYGGKPQDWQAEIFAGLDAGTLANTPKTIDFNAESRADPRNQIVVNTEEANGVVTGYRKPITTTAGTKIFAEYDTQGNLTGYSGDAMRRSFLSGNQSVSGRWDASGKATPQQYSSGGGGFLSNLVSDVGGIVTDLAPMALKAAALYYGGQALGGAMGGTEAALAGGTTAGGATAAGATAAGSTGGGLLTNAALDAQFIAADAAQLAGQGLSSGQIAQTLAASGVDSFIAADAAQLAAQGLGATQIAATLGASAPTSTAAAGGLFSTAAGTGAATAAGSGAGAATGAGMAGLTASQLGTLGLIQGGLGLAGGLLGGSSAADATAQAAAEYAKTAREGANMATFRPVGTTTRFGTSSFTTDPVTGAITANYAATPQAEAYQTALGGLATQGLQSGQTLMNLGQQYIGESPEAVRQRYIEQQTALLAPGQEQALAGIRNNLFQTGRTGLATGATQAGGLMATNPELAAYYNSLANQQRQIAAGAEQAAQQQVGFGQGLLNTAATPFGNVFTAQKGVEAASQQPLELSTNLANLSSTAGARAGQILAGGMGNSIASQQAAASYNPWATALQGAASNPLTGLGLQKLFS